MFGSSTVGEAVSQLEERVFVGRQRELSTFRHWLLSNTRFPEVLNVTGFAGLGKSSLLEAFRRIAVSVGKSTLFVDGHSFPATPGGFIRALGGATTTKLNDLVEGLNATQPLILLDTFDELFGLTDYLQQDFLPRLATGVKLVIASRCPLASPRIGRDIWHSIVRPLPLPILSPTDCHRYLSRRGVADPPLIDQVVRMTGGNPLALSLAADLVINVGIRDFTSAPEWHLVVRSLAEQLLSEAKDPHLRALLEACMAVRQFDEAALGALAGETNVSAAFDQLCQLSVVRAADHGLMLHDDVRRWLSEDLAWRSPQRYAELRAQALAYYRDRIRSGPASDLEWLVAERFFLWGNAAIQGLLFSPYAPSDIVVQLARASEYPEIKSLFSDRMEAVFEPEIGNSVAVPAEDAEFLEAALRYAGARHRIARDRAGVAKGFSTVVPVCRETIPLLDLHSGFAPLLHAYWKPKELAGLPLTAEKSSIFYVVYLVHAREGAGAARAALLRDVSSIFSVSGVYLCSTPLPTYKNLLEACGFQRVPGARNTAWGADYPVDGYVLDLSRIGFESWVQRVMCEQGPVATPQAMDVAVELKAALRHWTDDPWLGRCRLAEATVVERGAERPIALRRAILSALAAKEADDVSEDTACYRALKLTYLTPRLTRKQAVRTFGTSKATFYRRVNDGIRRLAAALTVALGPG